MKPNLNEQCFESNVLTLFRNGITSSIIQQLL